MAVTIDMMEYSTSALAQAAYVSSAPPYMSNADIDDEDMADISDWIDGDAVNSVSSQATFDSKSCMKFDTNTQAVANRAKRTQDIGSFGTRTVFSFNAYFDSIGTISSDAFLFLAKDASTDCYIRFGSDGLFVYDGAAYNEVGTNLVVQDVWQEWTFDVDWTAKTVDVYLDKVLKGSDVDCSADGGDDGFVEFSQDGLTHDNNIVYIDWFKAGSDFYNIEHTANIASADTFQTEDIDISGVANADKDAIDSITVTITNADA